MVSSRISSARFVSPTLRADPGKTTQDSQSVQRILASQAATRRALLARAERVVFSVRDAHQSRRGSSSALPSSGRFATASAARSRAARKAACAFSALTESLRDRRLIPRARRDVPPPGKSAAFMTANACSATWIISLPLTRDRGESSPALPDRSLSRLLPATTFSIRRQITAAKPVDAGARHFGGKVGFPNQDAVANSRRILVPPQRDVVRRRQFNAGSSRCAGRALTAVSR